MGSNENDILFGDFAAKYLATLAPEQIDQFEALIAETDTDLFNWVTGKQEVPERLDNELMALMKVFVQEEAARI